MKLTTIIFLVLFSLSVSADGPAVNFITNNGKVAVGGTVSIDLVMSDFPDSQGGGLNLVFNPKVVQVVQVTVDSSVWSFVQQSGQIDNSAGKVGDIIFAAFPGVSGDGKIATVEFRGLKKGNARLRLEESSKNPFSSNGNGFPVSLGKANLHVK